MLTGPVVFVVDDDSSVRTAISRLLASVGLPVQDFASAEEFLAQLECSPAGCLILDVRMPGCSGLDLQRRLREEGYELPVIFISAHADVALTVRAMRAGALQVFTKPFDDQALLDTVYEALVQDRERQSEREGLIDVRSRLFPVDRPGTSGPHTGRHRHAEQANRIGARDIGKNGQVSAWQGDAEDAGALAGRSGSDGGSPGGVGRPGSVAQGVEVTRFCRWTKVS